MKLYLTFILVSVSGSAMLYIYTSQIRARINYCHHYFCIFQPSKSFMFSWGGIVIYIFFPCKYNVEWILFTYRRQILRRSSFFVSPSLDLHSLDTPYFFHGDESFLFHPCSNWKKEVPLLSQRTISLLNIFFLESSLPFLRHLSHTWLSHTILRGSRALYCVKFSKEIYVLLCVAKWVEKRTDST